MRFLKVEVRGADLWPVFDACAEALTADRNKKMTLSIKSVSRVHLSVMVNLHSSLQL